MPRTTYVPGRHGRSHRRSRRPHPSPAASQRGRAGAAALHQDRDQRGVRRSGDLGGPGGLAGRPAGAAPGWQRRRRSRGHGRRPRRDRAVQLRHRRGRLLRGLRRHPPAVPTIDGRETAPRSMPHLAFNDPRTHRALQLHPRAGHERRLGGHARHPATWQKALVGDPQPGAVAGAGRRSWLAAGSWSTRPSTSRRRRTPTGSPSSPPPVGCSCRTAARAPSGRSSATPPSRRRTG